MFTGNDWLVAACLVVAVGMAVWARRLYVRSGTRVGRRGSGSDVGPFSVGGEATTPAEPVTGRSGGDQRRRWVAPLLIVVGVGAAALLVPVINDATRDDAGYQRALDNLAAAFQAVEYCWSGTAEGVDLTFSTVEGGTAQLDGKANGQCIDAGTSNASMFLYLSAQNTGESGSVECQIKRDGQVVAETYSEGAYVIATCKAP